MEARASASGRLSTKERWFLVGLFTFALVIRTAYLIQIRDNPFFENPRLDALFHDNWAQAIASGDILGDKVFFRAPLYPYFLGTLYAVFGHDYVVPRIVQHLLGALGLVALYLLARRLFGVRTAVVSSILASLYAILPYFEGELLFDSLLTFACLLWLIIAERSGDSQSFFRWLFAGVVYGVICCIRPPFLAIAPFLFGGLMWTHFSAGKNREAVRILSAIALGCLLPILPITIRNYVVGGDAVLIANQGGINFYIGNNPSADGHSSVVPGPRGASWENRDQTYLVEQALGHPPSPSEESWFWYKKGFQFAIEQPVQYATLLVKKAYLFWNWYEIPNNQNFYSFRKYSMVLQLLPVGFWIVGPLGMLGMIICIWKRRARFIVAFALLYSSVIILFFVCDRFRLPIVPLLCMFAAYALVALFEIARRKEWMHFAALGIIGVCCAFLVNSDMYSIEKNTRARDYLSLGIVELNKENYAEAIKNFELANTDDKPDIPNLFLNWGVAEWGLGNTRSAMEKFLRELYHYPDSYGSLSNLSYIYLALGKTDSAIQFGMRAIETKPYLPKAYLAVSNAHIRRGELEQAARVLEAGTRSCREEFRNGKILLAGIYNTLGKIDSAETLYREIIAHRARSSQPAYELDITIIEEDSTRLDESHLRAEAMYGLGHVWAARRNLDSSIFYFRQSIHLSPIHVHAWADLGVALMQVRRYVEADSAFNRVIDLQPENHIHWYNYGTLLGLLGYLSEADSAFSRALILRPDFAPAQEKIALTRELLEREGAVKQIH